MPSILQRREIKSFALVDGIAVLIFSLIIGAVLFSQLGDLGLSWDEPQYFYSGSKYVEWVAHPSLANINPSWGINHEHPPLHKFLAGTTKYIFSDTLKLCSPIAGYRISTVFFAIALLFGFYYLVLNLFGRWEAIASSIVLFLLPRVSFHMHLLSLDFSSMAMWVILSLVVWKNWITHRSFKWLGIISGLALLTKINAVLTLGSRIGLVLKKYLLEECSVLAPKVFLKREFKFFSKVGLIATFVTVLAWPWLWINPLRFFEFLAFHFHHSYISTFYFGKTYLIPPWHYPYVMFFITTPIVVFILFCIGFVSLLKKWKDDRSLFLLLNMLIPIGLVQISAAKYDLERLFLPSFPFIALISVVGMKALVQLLPKTIWQKSAQVVGTILLTAYLLFQNQSYHPYEGSYFSESIGGIKGAEQIGFDIHYWCTGYQDILEWVHENKTKKFWVPTCGHLFDAYKDYGKIDWVVNQVPQQELADYWIILNRPGAMHDGLYENIRQSGSVAQVQTHGVELVGVYKNPSAINSIERPRSNSPDTQ